MLELYHNDMSVCAQKVRLVLAYKKLDWQGTNLNLRAGQQFSPDFKKISPKGLVPVLVHNGQVVTESNVIIEYLEEVFPDLPLLSSEPIHRAQTRVWLTRLDAGLHEQVAVISFCIAFRHQMLERYPTDDALQGFFNSMSDPARRAVMQDIVLNGMDSPRLYLAALAYDKLIKDMAEVLAFNDYLVGDQMSLADLSFLPYIERLEQLQLSAWWSEYPQIERWLTRVRNTSAYDVGIGEWHKPDYIALMASFGASAWSQLSEVLKS
ncbi:glutathione S-transferase family protein [Arenicella xantha]|uniref:Glutathione S-transferase n=1 Tax=Arenicella xantha TaxID=644221 RepID=A0A395JFQ8_9GAMM|nr:glutathione S-transferase N-terminal domain-containing protein [Arenicella xantha]RBP47176.1 glutathione S-transferase [Arenicella xantha]